MNMNLMSHRCNSSSILRLTPYFSTVYHLCKIIPHYYWFNYNLGDKYADSPSRHIRIQNVLKKFFNQCQ